MSILIRALRFARAAIWSACKSIDLEDCTSLTGYILIGAGCWQIDPAYGYLVPGALIVVPRVLLTLMNGRASQPAKERRRWAS